MVWRGGLVQIFSGNGGQSELKLPGKSEKNCLCNFNHSYLAIRMIKLHKILPHVFIQVLYKILWLEYKKKHFKPFHGQCFRIGNFEWFLEEKCQRTLGVNSLKQKSKPSSPKGF